MKFLLLMSFLLAAQAHADGLSIHVPQAPIFYCCHVLLTAADGNADWSFTSESGGSHGGDAQEFRQGAHAVSVQVDKQWLTIQWSRGGNAVAAGQFVVGPDDKPAFKVGILFDPTHDGDQVAVSCDRAN